MIINSERNLKVIIQERHVTTNDPIGKQEIHKFTGTHVVKDFLQKFAEEHKELKEHHMGYMGELIIFKNDKKRFVVQVLPENFMNW